MVRLHVKAKVTCSINVWKLFMYFECQTLISSGCCIKFKICHASSESVMSMMSASHTGGYWWSKWCCIVQMTMSNLLHAWQLAEFLENLTVEPPAGSWPRNRMTQYWYMFSGIFTASSYQRQQIVFDEVNLTFWYSMQSRILSFSVTDKC